MNFQSLPIPPPRLQESPDPLRPVRTCGCSCIAACRCTCSCRDHCTCKARCAGDCTAHVARNLVVSFDRGFNKLGAQNTNVIELHSRVLDDPAQKQLTYYTCGIGTYVSSQTGTFKHWLRRLDDAIGWNSDKVLLKAYRWLCEQYQPGDRIFLFGFSRGAYQVRTLTAMIEKIGLVKAGSQDLIPLAYELFLEKQRNKPDAIRNFKTTFSRSIKIHFVGAWETVSPAPRIGRRPYHPPSPAEHVCMFRHALALDECRVIPAYVSGASKLIQTVESEKDESSSIETKMSTNTQQDKAVSKLFPKFERTAETGRISEAPEKNINNVKEVWFVGTHAYIGTGLKPNIDPILASAPLLWMENEAATAGLRLRSRTSPLFSPPTSGGKWNCEARRQDVLVPLRRFLEILPIKNLLKKTYGMTRIPHIGLNSRVIAQGQRVHASVAFMEKDYRPQAKDDYIEWQDFVGQNIEQTDFEWASKYGDRLEMGLLNSSFVMEALSNLKDLSNKNEISARESYWLKRLSFMALSEHLATTYLSKSKPIWDDDVETEMGCAVNFFQKLADQSPAIFNGDLAEILEAQGRLLHLHKKGDPDRLFQSALRIRRVAAAATTATVFKRYKLAASLASIGSYAVVMLNPQKALFLFEESLDVLRPLLTEEYPQSFPLFALLQRNFAICLKDLSHDIDLDTALRVAETIVACSRSLGQTSPQYNAVLAAALHDLAFGFPEGRSSLEPHAAEESINLYRNLAIDDPDTYNEPFSDALYNLSCRLYAAGQHEKALCASMEEARSRRELQEKDHLATCLDQLSRCFSATGKVDAALSTAEEAVRIRRRLAEENRSWPFESSLAASLSNLSCCLWVTTGRSENALHAAREAASIQRGLARDTPAEIFNLRLAVFLHNFSVSLSNVGRHAEALRAAEEALQIRTGWGDDSDCAFSLSRLASCLVAAGRHDEALGVAEKCLDLTRRLAIGEHAHNSDVQRAESQLAETMFSLSFCFTADQAPQAVEAVSDAVALYRVLAKRGSTAFNTALSGALLRLSFLLSSTGRDEEALGVAIEAVKFGQTLPKDCFSASLYHLSLCLYAVGIQDAMGPAHQCVELRRQLVEEYGTWQFKEQLVDSLFNLSLYLPHPQSLQAVREAVDIQRELAEYIPAETFNQRLADGLQNLSARALLAGQYDEALCSVAEAMDMTRKLVVGNPSQHSASLVNTLYTYANALCEHGQYEKAFHAISESDALRRTISSDSMFASVEASAAYMSTRARCVAGLGKREDALASLLEAIQLYWDAFTDRPPHKPILESFPWFLRNIFACICALGRGSADVVGAAGEVVELTRLLAGYSPAKFHRYLEEAIEFYASSAVSD